MCVLVGHEEPEEPEVPEPLKSEAHLRFPFNLYHEGVRGEEAHHKVDLGLLRRGDEPKAHLEDLGNRNLGRLDLDRSLKRPVVPPFYPFYPGPESSFVYAEGPPTGAQETPVEVQVIPPVGLPGELALGEGVQEAQEIPIYGEHGHRSKNTTGWPVSQDRSKKLDRCDILWYLPDKFGRKGPFTRGGKMEALEKALDVLRNEAEAEGSIIVGRDGLTLSQVGAVDGDVESIGALASNSLRSPQSLGEQLGNGGLVQVLMQFERGVVVVEPLTEDYVLVMVAGEDANIGMMRYALRKHKVDLIEALT
ncbi:MAG TPA: hypothetical protein EYP61_08985 [Candidatus Latescibacteria bacterium]|nr:hypothetical protein [Candidatus Latescibacterota bacterium]